MRPYYTSRKNMAKSFRQKITVAPAVLRAANGANVSLVAKSRKRIIKRKVYERPPTERPLSGDLMNSEQVRFRGVVGEVRNIAPHAQRRNDAEGISKTYPHDMELHFAEESVEETREQRLANIRAAQALIMRTGA